MKAEEDAMKHVLKHLAIASLAVAGFAAAGSAQNVPTVIQNQRARIRQGVRDGSLTRGEAARLRRRENRLRREVIRDRRGSGGLTRGEKARLRAEARRDSRAIARLRHNNRTR
jgi:hypothetical protein